MPIYCPWASNSGFLQSSNHRTRVCFVISHVFKIYKKCLKTKVLNTQSMERLEIKFHRCPMPFAVSLEVLRRTKMKFWVAMWASLPRVPVGLGLQPLHDYYTASRLRSSGHTVSCFQRARYGFARSELGFEYQIIWKFKGKFVLLYITLKALLMSLMLISVF